MTNSVDIIKLIIQQNESVNNLSFCEFGTYKLIQDRVNIINPLDQVLIKSLELRENHKLPFWDSFNVSLFDQDMKDFQFLKEINFHNQPLKYIEYNREDFLREEIRFQNYTAFSSLINGRNSDSHIILLDFHIPPSVANQKLCVNILHNLNISGYLLDSGKSYHFIGKEIVDLKYLQDVLFNSLLFSPIIDKSWIAHQLIQKHCCLRVSNKYGRLPYLVEEIK